MTSFHKYLLSLVLLVFFEGTFAIEPHNIGLLTSELNQYHDAGFYEKDLTTQCLLAKDYLSKYLQKPSQGKDKPAIVFDIDETLLSNYDFLVQEKFSGDLDKFNQHILKADDTAIQPTLSLYRYAQDHNIAIFLVSGRSEQFRRCTVENLSKEGFGHWTSLFLPKEFQKSAIDFKTNTRKRITEMGYHIVLNIGDQFSDLIGGYADESIKLPNPFYFVH